MLQPILDNCKKHNAQLIAVSKNHTVAEIMPLYQQGIRTFGENRVQELLEKQAQMPKDIDWHLIGHLQSNKVKQIVPFIKLIHSIDSLKLLDEIEKEAAKINKTIAVLLQLHVAKEETKFGLLLQEAMHIAKTVTTNKNAYQYIKIVGVMGMATNTSNTQQIEEEFTQIKNIFQLLKDSYYTFDAAFKEISMGMSSDYVIALQHGSTMVRVGSLLFE